MSKALRVSQTEVREPLSRSISEEPGASETLLIGTARLGLECSGPRGTLYFHLTLHTYSPPVNDHARPVCLGPALNSKPATYISFYTITSIFLPNNPHTPSRSIFNCGVCIENPRTAGLSFAAHIKCHLCWHGVLWRCCTFF